MKKLHFSGNKILALLGFVDMQPKKIVKFLKKEKNIDCSIHTVFRVIHGQLTGGGKTVAIQEVIVNAVNKAGGEIIQVFKPGRTQRATRISQTDLWPPKE